MFWEMKFSSDQTYLYPIPLFCHFVVNGFSICTHVTNVRLARRHHWLSQACLPLHYGLSSERLPHLARKVQDSGPRGVLFTALHPHLTCMSSSTINSLDVVSF